MLINTQNNLPEVGKVSTFMLTNGAEIIGEVTEVTDTQVTVKKPLTLGANGQGGFGLTPATMLGDGEGTVTYERCNVLAWAATRDEAEKGYMQYVSGIEIASKDALKNVQGGG